MKLNKWTAGLAALGAVSLASVAQADEKSSGVVASASSTILSGYVDTSMQWNIGDGPSGIRGTKANSHAPAYKYGGAAKSDGFNLDAVMITLEKPIDESEWAAGYKVDLFLGPDAAALGTFSTGGATDFSIKQAYVILNAPIGTGLDFKVGVFDSIIGYEATEAYKNPNFTRSWGHSIEPSTHTGVLATYRVNGSIKVSGGVADTITPTINARATNPGGNTSESYKTYMASLELTAPDDWGFLSGSTLDGGFVNGQQSTGIGGVGGLPPAVQQNYYAGVTLNTPITGLRGGFSWDYARVYKDNVAAHSFAAYASYQATEKLSFHERVEYADMSATAANAIALAPAGGVLGAGAVGVPSAVFSFTSTVQYDLWKNVLSRLEFRWDRTLDGTYAFGGSQGPVTNGGYTYSGTAQNSFILLANIIYKF